jgi:hypothetical protein
LKERKPGIFIVGTGRSGTWILYQVLGAHQAIHIFPSELRFLIDPDGVLDLLDSLTYRYSPVQAREALYRFERMMRIYLADPERTPYRGFNLPEWIGADYYWSRLDQFCSELVALEFEGSTWQVERSHDGRLVRLARNLQKTRLRMSGQNKPVNLDLPRAGLKLVKYFPDRSGLAQLAGDFVDDLFSNAARIHGKTMWCEKTPQHLLHLDFIYELFPESVVIHIKRDPRGVAHSLTKQRWAPSSLEGACLFLRDMYRRWFDLRESMDLSQRCYLEVKLEDFAVHPARAVEQVLQVVGMADRFGQIPEIESEKVNYWRKKMSSEEIQLANQILGPAIEKMGYEL